MHRLLLVGSVDALSYHLRDAFDGHEVAITRADTAAVALERLDATAVDCVVTSSRLPDLDGADLLRRVAREEPGVATALCVEATDREAAPAVDASIDEVLPLSALSSHEVADRIRRLTVDRSIERGREDHRRLQRLVGEVATAIAGASSREELARTACDAAAASPVVSAAWFGDYDGATGVVEPFAAAGIEVGALGERSLDLDPDGDAVLELSADVGRDSQWTHVVVPVVVDGAVEATLELLLGRAVDAAERDVLEELGAVLGAVLAARGDDAGSALEIYSGVVSHELRNHLQRAQVELDRARSDDGEGLDEIGATLERIDDLVEEAVLLSEEVIDDRAIVPESLLTLVESAWEREETDAATLSVDDDATVYGHPTLVRRLFENVIRNSLDHAGVDATVRAGTIGGEDGVYLEDDGPGIPATKRTEVFAWGESSNGSSGIGLAIVERIADAHGWDVAVADGDLGGARVEVTGAESGVTRR